MNLTHLVLSLATLTPAPQDANDLLLVDRVEVIVNDEILTYRQVMGTAARKIPEGVTLSRRQLDEVRREVGLDLIDERLEVQGGIDMGFEEQTVDRIVANNTEHRIGTAGGVVQMAEDLDDKGVSLFEQESELRRNLYRFSWERAITGANVGVSGRTFRDRYVRPGQLRHRYELLEAGMMGAEEIKGRSARYQLQELILPIPPADDADPPDVRGEKLRVHAEKLRVRAEGLYLELMEGKDFTTAVRETPGTPQNKIIAEQAVANTAGAPEEEANDGVLPPLTGLLIAKNAGKEVAAFAISATHGEISRPLPFLIDNKLYGWCIMKLLETESPILPVFELARTQTLLTKVIQLEADDYRRSEGLKILNQGAYIWPNH